MRRKSDKPENYEPSFEELRTKRAKEEYDKLPPALQELADQAEFLSDVLGFNVETEHHVCRPPHVSDVERKRLEKQSLADSHKHWQCACGIAWVWHWTSRQWHPVLTQAGE